MINLNAVRVCVCVLPWCLCPQAQVARLEAELAALRARVLDRQEVATQTEVENSESMPPKAADDDSGSESEGAASPQGKRKPGKRVKKGKKPAVLSSSAFPLETTLKAIQRIYMVSGLHVLCFPCAHLLLLFCGTLGRQDKIKADIADDLKAHSRQEFAEYVDTWLLNKYVASVAALSCRVLLPHLLAMWGGCALQLRCAAM